MKGFKLHIINLFAKYKLFWKLIAPFIKLSDAIKREHEKQIAEKALCKISEKIFSGNLTVRNGFFKGMIYPSFQSYGSNILPKLLGCYENEISEVLTEIHKKKYSNILDIGCAEGYYVVGLARNKASMVYAFDINVDAINFCKQMAELNNVSDKIILNGLCDEKKLCNFNFGEKSLIICDCEGFEKKLFTIKNIHNLKKCDLLIEIHDFIDITISKYIFNLFDNTHQIKIIKSVDDLEKIKTYSFIEIESLSFDEKKLMLSESRPTIMEWYWLTPRL